MKKYCKFITCLILSYTLTGCGNGNTISPASSFVESTQSLTMESNSKEEDSIEQDVLKDVAISQDNTLKLDEGIQELLHTSELKYTIEDRKYKVNQHKGDFNVSYPILKSEEKDMNVVNSVILARVVNELYYEDSNTTIDIDLNYEIKYATDAFISILFTGFYNTHGAAHPNNISFTINFDLNQNRPLRLYDMVVIEDNFLEKVHGAIKSQLDQEGLEIYERFSVNELYKQIYNTNQGFYMQDGKLYIRFSITAGSQHHEYISFNI